MNITNDKVTDFLNSYYKPLDKDLAELRAENEANNVPLILRETESILSILLKQLQPEHILEIGTAYGYSALFFAKALPNARITTIDRGPVMIPVATRNFESYPEGERIEFLKGDAVEMLDKLIEERKDDPYDFVFIDAGKSHYKEFFDRAEQLCRPGAFVVCDNILMRGWIVDRSYEGGKRHRTNIKYMKQFLDYINEREDLTVSMLSSGDGLALIKFNE
ncbi:MAG: O-methyltransferase [Clostridiales bacterium]|nr:O-methyltransferase [Candidatus Crickella caballi]